MWVEFSLFLFTQEVVHTHAFLHAMLINNFILNLFHRGVWKDPRYLEQKHEALRRDFRRKKYIYHRRDLMPKCVIELIPNHCEQKSDKLPLFVPVLPPKIG
jgi:hypothetical protein